jgi:DNA-binding XRE family transcriptional regulator
MPEATVASGAGGIRRSQKAECIPQTYDLPRFSVCRVQDLPDDDDWLPERRRAIGRRIRAERLRQNATQDQVWAAARIDRRTLQFVERGEEVKLGTLLRIAHVLGVPLSDLVR